MPPVACYIVSSRDSAWVGVFARSAMSSAYLIVCAGYRLLLVFFRVKLFSFIRSINVRST